MEKPILAAILSCAGTTLTDDEKRLFSTYNPLGISLFTRNIESASQLKKLVYDIKNTINREDVLIAVDEEGGRVSRLKMIARLQKIANLQFVAEEDLGKVLPLYCRIHAQLISVKMRKFGLNVNFAPVIDRKEEQLSLVLQSRCFENNAKKIVSRAKAMADSYMDMGICPCIKHLPGHFNSTSDPHLNLPEVDIPVSEIHKKIDYLKNFANYPLAMTAHVMLKKVDDCFPVTMSAKCINELLRQYLGFKSFLISDAIEMKALKGSVAEKMEKCLDAGLDAVCYCSGQYNDLYEICRQKRFMTEKAQIRFANIKKIIHNTPKEINTSEIEKRYRQKFQGCFEKHYAYDATEVLHQMLEKGENI